MSKIIVVLIDSIISSWNLLYLGSNITNTKLDYHKYKYYILSVILIIYLWISYLVTTSFIRVIISIILLTMIYINMFNISLKKSLITSFITLVIEVISELIYDLIMISILDINLSIYREYFFANIFANISVVLISVIIINLKNINIILNKINLKRINPILLFFTMIIIICVIYLIYYDLSFIESILIAMIFIISIINLYKKIFQREKDFSFALDNLNKYQELYLNEREISHEYKNNLILLKNMPKNKLDNYIRNILPSNKTNLNMPDVYLEDILKSKSADISVDIDIEPSFNIKDYLSIDELKRISIAHLFGIYLDNGIEAAKSINDFHILIVFSKDNNNFIIKIINHYKIIPSKDTRKGNGLLIANKIMKLNPGIRANTLIRGNTYIKTIKIKM